jgi:hypothetical protein
MASNAARSLSSGGFGWQLGAITELRRRTGGLSRSACVAGTHGLSAMGEMDLDLRVLAITLQHRGWALCPGACYKVTMLAVAEAVCFSVIPRAFPFP